jgi:nitroreductase
MLLTAVYWHGRDLETYYWLGCRKIGESAASSLREVKIVNTLNAIATRRSIRKFKDTPIQDEILQKILIAASQAPSAKNRQPWRFIIIQGNKRAEMVHIMREGIAHAKVQGEDLGSCEGSARVMEGAPITMFIFNPDGVRPWRKHTVEQMFMDVLDIQSIGAAIQNMLLAAADQGLGSLWICDVFISYEELCKWLGEKGELIAAVSFGYADESPAARPRKPMSEVVRAL